MQTKWCCRLMPASAAYRLGVWRLGVGGLHSAGQVAVLQTCIRRGPSSVVSRARLMYLQPLAPSVAGSLVNVGRIGKVAPARLQCAVASWPVKLRRSPARAGEDLLVASADKPFRFPATFTFVVRSFTVLDGIGKSLDPRFDISEIAAPYARDLILEAQPQFAKLQQEFTKRLDKQVPAPS